MFSDDDQYKYMHLKVEILRHLEHTTPDIMNAFSTPGCKYK